MRFGSMCYNDRVDSVTHTLIGVGMANALFRERVGRETVPILAVASNLPDIDALVHLTGDTTSILMRRTFGHSLLLIPIWSLVLALLLRRLYPHLGLKTLFGLSLLGAGVHICFDLVNSFGVVLLWPFSDWRPEWGILFIIDLVLTGLLAAPLLLSLVRKVRPHLEILSRGALVCVAAYVLFCGWNRIAAKQVLAEETARLGEQVDFSYVFPEPLGPHRWRGVIRTGEDYRIFLIHPLSRRIEEKGVVRTDLDDPAARRARASRLGRRLEWFFKAPVWTVTSSESRASNPGSESIEVSVRDLRFSSIVIHRESPFVYHFRISGDGIVTFVGGAGWSG